MIGADVAMHTPDPADPMARCAECQALLRFVGPCQAPTHGLQRMLDLANVEVGSWVSWRASEECEAEGRGGIVLGIDRVVDHETGEARSVYATVKAAPKGARYDRLDESVVGAVDPPDIHLIRSSWRSMAGCVSKRRGTALPEELRLIETIYRLMRSVA